MNNIIRSDIYRLRKGLTVKIVLLGLLALFVFVGFMFFLMNSDMVRATLSSTGSDGTEAVQELNSIIPQNATDFARTMLGDNALPYFMLPIIIAIFGADFSSGAYRNLLSYETNRPKVYLSKLALGIVIAVILSIISFVLSWLVGGIFLGFSGFTLIYLKDIAIIMLLQLPPLLAVICFGYLLMALTKKSGATIAVYLLVLVFLSTIIQLLTMLLPDAHWISLLDFSTAMQMAASYSSLSSGNLAFLICYGLLFAAGTTALGVVRFKQTDLH